MHGLFVRTQVQLYVNVLVCCTAALYIRLARTCACAGALDPCIDEEVQAYLNRPDVQRALHVNQTGNLPGPWRDCTPHLNYSM